MTEVVKPSIGQIMAAVGLVTQAAHKLISHAAEGHQAPDRGAPADTPVDVLDGDLLEVAELLAEAQLATLRWLEGPTDEDGQLAAALARWLPDA